MSLGIGPHDQGCECARCQSRRALAKGKVMQQHFDMLHKLQEIRALVYLLQEKAANLEQFDSMRELVWQLDEAIDAEIHRPTPMERRE
jgi:hypothetical protein